MFELVEHFKGRVLGLCFGMLGHRQDAEDVAQETFARVFRNLHRWDQRREFEPWLLAIAGNRCRTVLATRGRRPPHMPIHDAPTDQSRERARAEQLAEEVRLAIDSLRPDYRQAFVLFHDQELSYEQIAETLRRPLGTVKTWIHRARLELVQFLVDREVIHGARHEM